MELLSRIDLSEIVCLLEEVDLADEWKSCIFSLYSDFGIDFGVTPSLTFKETLSQYGANRHIHESVNAVSIKLALNLLPDNLPDLTKGYCRGGNNAYEMFLFKTN